MLPNRTATCWATKALPLFAMATFCLCSVPAEAQRTIRLPVRDGDQELMLLGLTEDSQRLVATSRYAVMVCDLEQDLLVANRAFGPDFLPARALVAEDRWVVGIRDSRMPNASIKPDAPWMQVYPLSAIASDTHQGKSRNIDLACLVPEDERPLKDVFCTGPIVAIDEDRFAAGLRITGKARRRSQEKPRSVLAIISVSKAKVIEFSDEATFPLLGQQGGWLTGIDFVKREENQRRPLTKARHVRYPLDDTGDPNGNRSIETGPIHTFPGLMLHFIYSPTSDLVFFSRPRLGVPFLGDVTTGRMAPLNDLAPNLNTYSGSFSRGGSLLAIMGTQQSERGAASPIYPYPAIAVYDARRATRIATFPLDSQYQHDGPRISSDNRLLVARILEPEQVPAVAGGWLLGTPVGFRVWELDHDGSKLYGESISEY